MNYTIMANESTTYLHDGMELPVEDWSQNTHSFDELTKIIRDTHDAAQTTAVKAINRMQTMRNWLYGYYIIEFEQRGKDWAEYGTQLLKRLEERVNRKGLTETLFKNSRKFYRLYPQMVENIIGVISPTVSDKLLETKDATWRQSSYWHSSMYKKRQEDGGIRSRRHGQPTLCINLHASVARQENA